MNTRKHYIDNLRSYAILVVFLFHVLRPYSMFETFYIHGEELLIPSIIEAVLSFTLMPLLFAVAGVSSRYALEKRSAGEYAKERVNKLLIPFIFGVLLVVPIQPYLAQRFRHGDAGYFGSFTRITDLSGYDGAFSIAHLWFLLFLFIISLVCLPFLIWYKNKGKGTLGENIPLFWIVLMGLLPAIGSLLKISGKSPTEYLAYFLLGYFFLANDSLLCKLEKYRHLLLGLFVVTAAVVVFVLDGNLYEVAGWISVLAVLGYSRRHLDYSGKVSAYLSSSSFGVYVFHQSWIIVVAFFVFMLTDVPLLQIPLILVASVLLTYASYEICKRLPVVRWMLGLKK